MKAEDIREVVDNNVLWLRIDGATNPRQRIKDLISIIESLLEERDARTT